MCKKNLQIFSTFVENTVYPIYDEQKAKACPASFNSSKSSVVQEADSHE